MAKRYFSFEKLSESLTSNIFEIKPAGTLGRHMLEIKKVKGGIAARGIEKNKRYDADLAKYVMNYDEKGIIPISSWVVVEEGGTLGYNCGSVWAIKPAHKMSPLQRFRHTFRLSKENVILLDKLEEIKTEGLTSAVSEDSPYTNHNRFWGSGEIPYANTENCAITDEFSFHGGTDQRRCVGKVYLLRSNLEKAIEEASAIIEAYKPRPNIKHHANGLLFA